MRLAECAQRLGFQPEQFRVLDIASTAHCPTRTPRISAARELASQADRRNHLEPLPSFAKRT